MKLKNIFFRTIFLIFLTIPNYAANFYVTPSGVGDCSANSPCSFQTALTNASLNSENDIIHVGSGIYNLTTTLIYSVPNGNDNGSLTIIGDNVNNTILNGNGTIQILLIDTDNNHTGGDDNISITIKNLSFKNANFSNDGGGLFVHTNSGLITISNSIFDSNIGYEGGGIYIFSWNNNITISNSIFNNNTGYSDGGGGVYIDSENGEITITNSIFTKNNGGDDRGGGVYITTDNNNINILNSIFKKNISKNQGGGAYLRTGYGNITIQNSIFDNNTTEDGLGGGVYINNRDNGYSNIINNTFFNNHANNGGGIYLFLQGNPTTLNLYNNIFWQNHSDSGSDTYVRKDDNNGLLNIYNNDFSCSDFSATNPSSCIFITNTITYNHDNNISANPLFVNPYSGDFHIRFDSPCIDAGDNDAPEMPSTDFEGDHRIINGIVDIGADEFYQTLPVPSFEPFGILLLITLIGIISYRKNCKN